MTQVEMQRQKPVKALNGLESVLREELGSLKRPLCQIGRRCTGSQDVATRVPSRASGLRKTNEEGLSDNAATAAAVRLLLVISIARVYILGLFTLAEEPIVVLLDLLNKGGK